MRDRKRVIFNGDQDIREWAEDVRMYVDAHFTREADKTAYIMHHIEGPAKLEVKVRDKDSKVNSKEMLEFLIEDFGARDTLNELTTKFYSCTQGKDEPVEKFCQHLMEIVYNLRRLGWKTLQTQTVY